MSTEPSGYQTPKTNWQAADVVLPADMNRIEGNINAIETGSRTIDQNQAPTGLIGTLRQFLDWFAYLIKAIKGTTNYYDAPPTTLAAAKSHIDAAAPHSGHETPAGAQAKVDAHAALTSVHGATSAATANRIMMRDAFGRAQVAAPSASDDIARKDTIDNAVSLRLPISALFGDGSDGNATIASTTTLTRDMFYNNLTVNNGVTLNTANYRVFVKGTLTINGAIACNGNRGDDSPGDKMGGYGGPSVGAGWLRSSGAGGDGGEYDGSPVAKWGDNVQYSLGGSGGKGGDGYSASGASGGTASPVSTFGWTLSPIAPLIATCDANGNLITFTGGGGGGGGGNGESGGSATGAGGGSGGGIVAIFANSIVLNGTVQAIGGDGGTGYGYPPGSTSGSGGGGGGGGGAVVLVYKTKLGAGSISAAGGSAGAGGKVAAQPGSPGQVFEIAI